MRCDRGQSTVEAALTLPVVLIALLMIVQVGVVVRDALVLAHAAREGARAAAVSDGDAEIRDAVMRSAGSLDAGAIDITIEPSEGDRRRGNPVTVDLAYTVRLRIPVVSRIVDVDLPLRASTSMRMERTNPTPSPPP